MKATVYVRKAESPTADTIETRDAVDGAGFFDRMARSAHLEIAHETTGGYSKSRRTGRYVVRYSRGAKRFAVTCATEKQAFAKAERVWVGCVSWVEASKAPSAKGAP